MGNNSALNSHFQGINPIQIDPPDTIGDSRPDLIISSFQCDATTPDHLLFAATVRNIGSAKAVIPATQAGGSLSVLLLPTARLDDEGARQTIWARLNNDVDNDLELEPGEEVSRVFSVQEWPGVSFRDFTYVVLDLVPNRHPFRFGPTPQDEDFIRLGNNIAMMPIIWR